MPFHYLGPVNKILFLLKTPFSLLDLPGSFISHTFAGLLQVGTAKTADWNT